MTQHPANLVAAGDRLCRTQKFTESVRSQRAAYRVADGKECVGCDS